MKKIEFATREMKEILKGFKTIKNKDYGTFILKFEINKFDCKIYGLSKNMDILENYIYLYKNYDESKFDIYVDFDKIEQFMKNVTNTETEIILNDDNNIILQSGEKSLKINEINTSSFDHFFNSRIHIKDYEEVEFLELDKNIFDDYLKYHLNFISDDETKPAFTGVHFNTTRLKNMLEVESVDGFKVHRNIFKINKEVCLQCIIKNTTFKSILKLIKLLPKKSKETIKIYKINSNESSLNVAKKEEYKIKIGSFIIYIKNIEEEFLKVEQVIDGYSYNAITRVKTDMFIETLKNFNKKDGVLLKLENSRTLYLTSFDLKRNKKDDKDKNNYDEMTIEFKEIECSDIWHFEQIAFDVDYLLKTILPYENIDYINLNLIKDLSPLVIEDNTDNVNTKTICLPVRYKK